MDLRTEGGGIERAAVAPVDPQQANWLRQLQGRRPMDPDGPHPVAQVIRGGEAALIPDMPDEMVQVVARDATSLAAIRKLAPLSVIIAPLTMRGRTLGALTPPASGGSRRYGPENRGLAEELAIRAALAIDNAGLFRDVERRVQEFQTLLDVLPVAIAVAQDPERRDIRGNRAMLQIMGAAEGANVSISVPVEQRLPVQFFEQGRELTPEGLPMQFAAAHGVEVRDTEMDLVRADGRVISLFAYASPLYDERGKVRGCLGAFVDVTDHRRAERERALSYEAERAARGSGGS
ncbi:MAG: PAS domain-containing protein [Chloroflexi bacterium]|nr:PAS domain-containing protein [Chloroflexota bacterium]